MTVFHGSEFRIEKPYVGGGKTTNDYGSGFYCTESEDLACEWAVTQKHDGYANKYALDMRGLRVLDLNGDGYCVLHWLLFCSVIVRLMSDTALRRWPSPI